MGHNLFGERFASHRDAAWHHLGTVYAEGQAPTARQAFEDTGAFDVRLQPLYRRDGVGNLVELDSRIIVRDATPDDPKEREFGIVSKDYGLISPSQFVDIWDSRVGQPIETYGALGGGSTMFLSTHLPDISIRGDEIKNYMLATSPMTGNDSATIRVTPIRVVCQNTLIAAQANSMEVYRIIHDATALDKMGNWLQGVYDRAIAKSAVLKEAFEILADHQVTSSEVTEVLEFAYPLRTMTRFDAPEETLDLRELRIVGKNRQAMSRREAAMELFEGAGTGLQDVRIRGTAWSLYNAIVETEDYRKGRSDRSIAEESLVGRRAAVKERAFTATHKVATGQVVFSLN